MTWRHWRRSGVWTAAALMAPTMSFAKLVQRIAALATGRLQIMREMREIDDRLGLTPKGLAALRWKIVDDTPKDEQTGGSSPRYGKLRAV